MDKNTVTGFILLALLTVAYVLYSSNEQKKFQEAQKIEAAKTEKKEKIIKDSISKSELIKPDSIIVAEKSKQLGSFSNFAVGEDRLIKVETDESIYTFSSKGGDIKSIELKNFKTYDKQPLLLFDSTQNAFDISFNTAEGKKFKSSNIYFNTDAKDIKLSGDQKTTISFKIESAPGKYYEHLYTIQGNQFLVDFKVNAVGFNDIINTEQLNLNWNLNMPSLESNVTEERMYSTVYYRMDDKSVEELSTSKSESIKSELPVQWVSFKQKFFNVSLIGVKNFSKEASLSIKNGDEKSKDFVKDASTQLSVPYDKSSNFSFAMQWYAGPNKYKELKKLDIGLDEIIPLGWGIF
jgi:YidC/Oxa1 family membrane protein insertase